MSIMRVGGVWCWLLALPAPTSVIMALGGDPPRDPLAPPLSVKPLSLAPSSASPLRHSRGLHGNPVLECVRLSSPSVILGPCPGIQFLIGKNRTGFPPSVRMTEGKEGDGHFRAFFPFAVILVASTGIQSWSVLHFPTPSFSWPPRESSLGPHSGFPPAGENDGGEGGDGLNGAGFPPDGWDRTGFPPSVRMTEGKGGRWLFPRLFSFRCHSRGLHGNPVLECVAFSYAVILVASTGIQSWTAFWIPACWRE